MAKQRRWMNSVDVEIESDGQASFDKNLATLAGSASTIAGGTKTVAATGTPGKLVASSTPCRFVWIGARVDANGAAQNTKPCFIGNITDQNIPVMPANYEGVVIAIDDATKLYVKVGVNGEGVVYRIFARG